MQQRQGELQSDMYALYSDINYELTKDSNTYYQSTVIVSYELGLYIPFIDYKKISLVNKNRISIGLDSFQVSQRKFLCNMFDVSPYYFEPYTELELIPTGLFDKPNNKKQIETYRVNEEKFLVKCPH